MFWSHKDAALKQDCGGLSRRTRIDIGPPPRESAAATTRMRMRNNNLRAINSQSALLSCIHLVSFPTSYYTQMSLSQALVTSSSSSSSSSLSRAQAQAQALCLPTEYLLLPQCHVQQGNMQMQTHYRSHFNCNITTRNHRQTLRQTFALFTIY